MKRLLKAGLALALLAGPIPAARADPGLTAAVAEALRPTLPRTYSGDVVLVGVEAIGSLLVLNVEIPAGTGLSREELARVFVGGFCEDPGMDEIFARGVRIRLDVRAGRGPLEQGVIIDRCLRDERPPSST